MLTEMRDYISERFGDGGFMVRRDMVNNVVDYRVPWTFDPKLPFQERG